MKKVILLVLIMPFQAYGQIIENFETGSLTNWVQSIEGRWNADTTSPVSGRFSLHHVFDNPDAGSDCIGIQVKNLHPGEGDVRCSFRIMHGYEPSSSNNWAVYLISDAAPAVIAADGSVNGYAVGVNLTGSDDTLRLWKIRGNKIATVVNCGINWQNDIGTSADVRITAERSVEGKWIISVHRRDETLIAVSQGTDGEIVMTAWFVVRYKYSSSRDRMLWIDNITIEGIFHEDINPPGLTGCITAGKDAVRIVFDEMPDDKSVTAQNFSIDGLNRATSVIRKSDLEYLVMFAGKFENKVINNLIINKLCDMSGNCVENMQVPFAPAWAERGDVVITEIMCDPTPEVSLPPVKYIELTNRTGYQFNLSEWMISTVSTTAFFPETHLPPSGILLICSTQDTSYLLKYGMVKGIKQFPSLTETGKLLCLEESPGMLIHGVEYSSGWYGDELKSGGGWSLEMTDLRFPFFQEGNWKASSSKKGGTPGSSNSSAGSNPDYYFQGILNVFPDDSTTISIKFSEPVFDLYGKPGSISIKGEEIVTLNPVDPLNREFSVKVSPALAGKKTYELNVSPDMADFAGNHIRKGSFAFGLAENPGPGEIMFNELLFNPLPGDPDYIELYNCSGKIIDAGRLVLVSVNDATGDTSQLYPVSPEKRCIMPGSFFALTTDKGKICSRYLSADPEFIFEVSSMPSMPDDKGHLVLYSRELDRIDEVYYSYKMHYSLLTEYEGIALEKTGPLNSSGEAVNWHSASGSSGWGTPGAPNSIHAETPADADEVTFSSSRITPNSDGNEDILEIRFRLEGTGNVISVTIFDERGNHIKKVAENFFAGQDAVLIWDGTADDGTAVNTGIYIVFISLYNDTGRTGRWKKVCTVIRR
jgi:hypothetical protein